LLSISSAARHPTTFAQKPAASVAVNQTGRSFVLIFVRAEPPSQSVHPQEHVDATRAALEQQFLAFAALQLFMLDLIDMLSCRQPPMQYRESRPATPREGAASHSQARKQSAERAQTKPAPQTKPGEAANNAPTAQQARADAEKILDLSGHYTQSELKKAYYRATQKNQRENPFDLRSDQTDNRQQVKSEAERKYEEEFRKIRDAYELLMAMSKAD